MMFRALRAARQGLISLGSTKPAQGIKLSTLASPSRLLRGGSLDSSSRPLSQHRPSLGSPQMSRRGASLLAARPYVTRAGADVLNKVPVIQAAIKVATIQQHAACGANSGSMQVALADALTQTGALQSETCGDGKSIDHLECPIKAQDLVQLNNLHGPLLLTVKNSLQPDQGRDHYVMHHAMLLVATFEDKNGRTIGVCIDGNDLTDNEVTKDLRLQATQRGEWYPDGRLVADSKEMDDYRDKTGDDSRRGLVRLIPLNQLQEANEGDYDVEPSRAEALGVRVKGALMSAEHRKLLQDGVVDGSLLVEEFLHVPSMRPRKVPDEKRAEFAADLAAGMKPGDVRRLILDYELPASGLANEPLWEALQQMGVQSADAPPDYQTHGPRLVLSTIKPIQRNLEPQYSLGGSRNVVELRVELPQI